MLIDCSEYETTSAAQTTPIEITSDDLPLLVQRRNELNVIDDVLLICNKEDG